MEISSDEEDSVAGSLEESSEGGCATDASADSMDDFIVPDDDESCVANAGSDSERDTWSDGEDEVGVEWVNGVKEYEVERILSHRIFHDATYFLVRWAGYTSADDMWLPVSELRHARELVKEYKDSVGLD